MRYGLSLTLGGGEVRLLDLAAAYGAFANGGYRVTPFAIQRVESLEGEVLFDAERDASARTAGLSMTKGERVLDARVAYLITDILSDDLARQPAFGTASMLEIGRRAAVKTGTTSDWRDNWRVGYTPNQVVGVWVGNADNSPMVGVSGVAGAAPIWHDFMASIERGNPPLEFPRPEGLTQMEVCADSGLTPDLTPQPPLLTTERPSSGEGEASAHPSFPPSPETGVWSQERGAGGVRSIPCPTRRLEWFIAGTEPVEVDRSHVQIVLDVRSGEPADERTPAEFKTSHTYWRLPSEFREWAVANHYPQPPLDAAVMDTRAAPEAGRQASAALGLRLTSPDAGAAFRIDPALPARVQRLPVTVRPGTAISAPTGSITIMVDGAPLADVSGPDFTFWWPLTPGRHTFQAAAAGAVGHERSDAVTITVTE